MNFKENEHLTENQVPFNPEFLNEEEQGIFLDSELSPSGMTAEEAVTYWTGQLELLESQIEHIQNLAQ